MNEDSIGQIAYEGYYKQTGGVTYDGRPMPSWFGLSEATQVAWQAAAQAVATRVDETAPTDL